MRPALIAFRISIGLLIASLAALGWTRLRAEAPSPPPATGSGVCVTSFVPHELTPATALAAVDPGRLVFRAGPGEKLIGIGGLRAYPAEGDVPELIGWTDLWQLQLGERVDCRPWLEKPGAPVEAFVMFNLIVEDAEQRREYRQGWTRLDTIALRATGLEISADAKRRAELTVATASGQRVPGALLTVDPTDIPQIDLASQFVATGADGVARISGLEAATTYRVVLPGGIGPDGRTVSVSLAPEATSAAVVTALSGNWTFARHRLVFGLPGSTVRVDKFEVLSTTGATAWPVANWVPPGQGRDASFWVMLPAATPASALPARLTFPARGSVEIPDLRTPATLVFPPFTKTAVRVDSANEADVRAALLQSPR